LPIVTDVQGIPRVASVGCLMTDGHTTYMLTSRHVAGAAGGTLVAAIGGQKIKIGTVSDKQLGVVPFERLYDTWAGKAACVNPDAALVEIGDIRGWEAAIVPLGPL